MTEKNFKKLFTIYFIIFGFVISLVGGAIGYNIQLSNLKNDLDTKANETMIIKKFTVLKNKIEDMDHIVSSISKNSIMKSYIETKDEHELEKLKNIFFAIASVDSKIMQLRYIDKDGMEQVRVDRTSEQNEPVLIAKEQLQNKEKRNYFQTISSMQEVKIWHSKFDLNMEKGKIEVPYRPTFRVGIPLFNKQHEFAGIVIANMLTNNLFDSIRTSAVFRHYIIDKEGNFIIHPNQRYSFNKYTGESRVFTEDFPKYSSEILSLKKECGYCYVYTLNDVLNNEDGALLILKPKAEYKDELLKNKLKSTLYIILLSMAASFIMAFYASVKPSELQKALLKANEELKRFASILDRYVVSAKTKKDSTIIDVSSAFEVSSGYIKEELIGKPMNIIRHESNPKSLYKDMWKTILNKKEWSGEIKNRRKNGEEFWLDQNIIPVLNDDGKIDSFFSVGEDITIKKELEILSSIDKLTGILNRRKLDEFLEYEVAVARRYLSNLSLIIVDIDHFKEVNDTYGHQTGDMVLFEVTKMISKLVRKPDIFGRFGGEEFLIICPQTSKEEAFALAEKLRKEICDYTFDKVGQKTISLGIAQFEENYSTEDLVKKADIALYEAKNTGRNKSVIYTI
ncbi:GGDEF domain-containing protein [Sulfurimonas sp.]|uniref:sensor domain-containing diguanylate cyclase n=1 Tax=Sulfurimonas sp. TaxID=2022749 RepID=UPI003567B4A6